MAYAAKILQDSLSPDGVRLTTMEVTFPRIVLAEFNTHRMFSRNSASSRAIPIAKMLDRVQQDPFVPIYWGKNQKGMQAAEELTPEAQARALEQWMLARDNAVNVVQRLQLPDIDLHKQIANRLLEPWLFHTVIVTATEWDNFWALRCDPMAQPEIKRVADMMRALYVAGKPSYVGLGDWHLPLVDDFHTLKTSGFTMAEIVKICVGRCTRVSYLTHDGKRDPKADIELCERLLKSGHMSPFEHAARPMSRDELTWNASRPPFNGNFRGWVQARKEIANEDNFARVNAG
jgi:thymidylate synthase ThyX